MTKQTRAVASARAKRTRTAALAAVLAVGATLPVAASAEAVLDCVTAANGSQFCFDGGNGPTGGTPPGADIPPAVAGPHVSYDGQALFSFSSAVSNLTDTYQIESQGGPYGAAVTLPAGSHQTGIPGPGGGSTVTVTNTNGTYTFGPFTAGGTFADVPSTAMFSGDMTWLASNGVSTGWTEADGSRTYRPGEQIDRDAMAAFMYRLSGRPPFTSTAAFADTAADQFSTEINWAGTVGISTGYTAPDGSKTFQPGGKVNRDAMAAFMYRLAGSPAYTVPATSYFSDVKPGDQFYAEISWMHDAGISTGYPNGDGTSSYRPLTPVNRDAMAAFLHRLSDNVLQK